MYWYYKHGFSTGLGYLLESINEEEAMRIAENYSDCIVFEADLVLMEETEKLPAYDNNGDMLANRGDKFRQVGWQINGGDWDKRFVKSLDHLPEKLGGYSPVYVEIND